MSASGSCNDSGSNMLRLNYPATSVPATQLLPVAEPPPRIQTPQSPRATSILPLQPAPTVAPPSPAALPMPHLRQPATISMLPIGRATRAPPMAYPTSGMSGRRESEFQGGTFLEARPSRMSHFGALSFVKHMKNIRRAYRNQAVTLISFCRTFVQAQEQTPASDAKLRR
jgi:hypothetical protein